ncbi:hypothetical protein [Nitrosomonas ureae]|nr:hypothetical protein [Nitrosomonas ureae]
MTRVYACFQGIVLRLPILSKRISGLDLSTKNTRFPVDLGGKKFTSNDD